MNIRDLLSKKCRFPVWLNVLVTVYVLIFIPVYWVERGPANFLWFCDIALFITVFALWYESRLLASINAIGILLPELAWNLDFFFRLITGNHLFGLQGTAYMFTSAAPMSIRVLSLFHLFLPILVIWMLYRLGYDNRAFLVQTLIAWIVLPISCWVSSPSANINWIFGLGSQPQTWMPPYLFVIVLMVFFPVCVYLPTHLLLNRLVNSQ